MADTAEEPKKAFIIMPISVPEHCLPLYEHSGGKDHFQRVLDALLIPAVESIGYVPVPPSFPGTTHIQAEIVQALSNADLVLCDMSALNPNVFFELGARSALNLPVALIVDEHHEKAVPFDLKPIGYRPYQSSLHAWEKDAQVQAIAEHMQETTAKGNQNALWKYFGVNATAEFNPSTYTQDDKLDAIMRAVNSLQNTPRERPERSSKLWKHTSGVRIFGIAPLDFVSWLEDMIPEADEVDEVHVDPDVIVNQAYLMRLMKMHVEILESEIRQLDRDDGLGVPIRELVIALKEHPKFLRP